MGKINLIRKMATIALLSLIALGGLCGWTIRNDNRKGDWLKRLVGPRFDGEVSKVN